MSLRSPAGLAGRLPVGLSLLGARWSDAELLSLAAAFESATRAGARCTYQTVPSDVDLQNSGQREGAFSL